LSYDRATRIFPVRLSHSDFPLFSAFQSRRCTHGPLESSLCQLQTIPKVWRDGTYTLNVKVGMRKPAVKTALSPKTKKPKPPPPRPPRPPPPPPMV
jgi:hypothetical protein